MRRVILSLLILLLASTASAELPYLYECHYDDKQPLEVDTCAALAAAMDRNDAMVDVDDLNGMYFHLVVLPTARDGYISVTLASSLIFPPLNGLALSAYIGGFMLLPEQLCDEAADELMGRLSLNTAEWLVEAEDDIRAIPGDIKGRPVMAMLGGEDE